MTTAESALERGAGDLLGEHSLADARAIIKDLFRPEPKIYWMDFLCSILTAHAAFLALDWFAFWWPGSAAVGWGVQAVLYVVCVGTYYRAGTMIHELAHLPREGFRAFRLVWNSLCGCMVLLPSFMYATHTHHHRRGHYGTKQDGEYMPLERQSRWHLLGYLMQPFVIPFLLVIRYFILTPLTWLHPRIRDLVHQHASSMVVVLDFVRAPPRPEELPAIRLQELVCFLWCSAATLLVMLRPESIRSLIVAYCIYVGVLFVNHLRTIGAHRYHGNHGEMTFREQLLDSVNYPNYPLISGFWGPIGMRFHALHHLFPSLPYHAMAEAHRRLKEQLPANSPYHQTESRSLTASIWDLWRRAGSRRGASRQAQPAT